MSVETLFSAASQLAIVGWVVLLASPFLPRWTNLVPGMAIPALIGIGYIALIFVGWSRAEGGFDSLDAIAQLFQSRTLLAAGWLHYLAFDLFVGAWVTRQAQRVAMPFWLVVPCLGLCFLFGPAGFLLFLALRAATLTPAPRNA